MEFYEVFERVVDLLRRQGRVSYRALKRQFALDDDYLEDLKAELIAAKRLAIDEQGTVLVWIGESTTPTPLDQDQGRAALCLRRRPHRPAADLCSHPECHAPRAAGHSACPGGPSRYRAALSCGRTPPAHGAVLRPGGLDPPGPAV